MTLKDEALKAVDRVPIGNLPELIKFARFLRSSYEEELEARKTKKEKKPARRSGGWVKGEVWMSEDFNDPLEFVSEEEMRVLEAMRNRKQAHQDTSELQEEAV